MAGHCFVIERRIVLITKRGNGDSEVDAGSAVRALHVRTVGLGEIVLR